MALSKKYEGDYAIAKANVEVYLQQMVGIGEHPDLAEAIDSQIAIMVDFQDKLKVVQKLLEGEE